MHVGLMREHEQRDGIAVPRQVRRGVEERALKSLTEPLVASGAFARYAATLPISLANPGAKTLPRWEAGIDPVTYQPPQRS